MDPLIDRGQFRSGLHFVSHTYTSFGVRMALTNDLKPSELNPALAVPRFRQLMADLWAAIKTAPGKEYSKCVWIVFAYSLAALMIGFTSGIYTVQILDVQKYWFLPSVDRFGYQF